MNDRAKLLMHRFVARAILRDPSVVDRARQVVDGWRGGPLEYDHAAEWQQLLSLPVADLARTLVRRGEVMDRLRSSSPFRGLVDGLNDAEFRLRLWRKARLGLQAATR